MSDYVERMKTERNKLKDKIDKLHSFIYSERFSVVDKDSQILLIEQSAHMRAYLEVLDKRLWIAHGNN